MGWGRGSLSAVLSLALVACGGDDGGSTPPPISGGGATPAPTPPVATCSLSARQNWTFAQLDEFYLFPTLIDRSVQASNYSTVQDYIDALVAPARARNFDNFATYITSIEEEQEAIESGSNAGFGFILSFNNTSDRLFVAEAFENAAAFQAGIDRGAELLTINGQSVTTLLRQGGYDAVGDAFGPGEPGVTRTIGFLDANGVQREASITKTEYDLDPVSDRYGVKILNDNGRRVGYLALRTFFTRTALEDLRAAFQQFQNENVSEVILDLRYNGGGLIEVAELLGDLMGREYVGQVFSRTVFRDSLSSNNVTYRFGSQPQAITVTKLAVIGTEGTASASELVAIGMIPYLGENVALIGSDTFGKPVGQIAIDREACDDRLRVIAFKTENASGQSDYFDGIANLMPRTCRAEDDLSHQFGSPQEASVSTALDFLAGRSCTPIPTTGVQGTRSVKPQQKGMLQNTNPSALQHQIPGLF